MAVRASQLGTVCRTKVGNRSASPKAADSIPHLWPTVLPGLIIGWFSLPWSFCSVNLEISFSIKHHWKNWKVIMSTRKGGVQNLSVRFFMLNDIFLVSSFFFLLLTALVWGLCLVFLCVPFFPNDYPNENVAGWKTQLKSNSLHLFTLECKC